MEIRRNRVMELIDEDGVAPVKKRIASSARRMNVFASFNVPNSILETEFRILLEAMTAHRLMQGYDASALLLDRDAGVDWFEKNLTPEQRAAIEKEMADLDGNKTN